MKISEIDKRNYTLIRSNIENAYKQLSLQYDRDNVLILDVAPQIHKGTKEFFKRCSIETLDIDASSNSTFLCDLCENNSELIPDSKYDLIFCMEVLEHVANPFAAAKEIYRMLKRDGLAVVSTPFNFRIHNPLPDNWRFTEHGLKILFSSFNEVNVIPLNDKDRFLMPIHYILFGKK
jgi:SAM-dependent methyltransferase